jgi:hypothetical protein
MSKLDSVTTQQIFNIVQIIYRIGYYSNLCIFLQKNPKAIPKKN